MRTDFPYELYSRPVAVQVGAKLTICAPEIGQNVYLYFEHGDRDYWVMPATFDLIAAIQANLSLPYWDDMRKTQFWYNQLATVQSRETGLDYKSVRSWYPEGAELTNDVLLSDYS
ncbi:MAG: hypothetical protein [Siphoviridae sp. ctdc_1]|nr:MAG: hypothetical protein [Siphoviridae sp. ctdc_1]